MLAVKNLTSYYSNIKILKDISFSLEKGKVLCLLGRNGAGKTTTLKSLMGLVDKTEGLISFNDEKISGISAHYIPKKGIGYVPQGRRLFSELTVEENLEIGLLTRGKGEITKNNVLTMFPRLKERLDQISGTLSGGEQQMLALARALCIEPSLLLLDEPTEGLQPSMISLIRKSILELKKQGVAILLVEQRVEAILSIADEILVIENGSIVFSANANEVQKDHKKLYSFLGV
ncbi:MAG: ABC transporter ATP-binding protein [SAR116 cluster bacterium]|jgi:branched-chain amino acid transport system ATP-binding protein|nr:ABC transporter ATP-binding protein [SAR116 cluster bacterium]|tara:strand:- start:806 stop:1501 length:696 start_codon:yes stop_codon:yes gene_type:complete